MIARLLCSWWGHRWEKEDGMWGGASIVYCQCWRCRQSGVFVRTHWPDGSPQIESEIGHPDAVAECRKRAA